MNKKIKGLMFLSLISTLSFYSCNTNHSKSLWNRVFKSTGGVYVNWDDKVGDSNKTNYQLLKENFTNVDFENSGYYFYTTEGKEVLNTFSLLNYVYEFPIDNFEDFKYSIDHWWENDKEIIDEYYSFYGLKKSFDQLTFRFKLDDNSTNKGKLYMEFMDYNNKPTYDEYIAYDESTSQDGSEIILYKDLLEEKLTMVGYAYVSRYSNKIDIVQIRSGYNDESSVRFIITFKNPVDGISSFEFYNNIVVKEYTPGLPVWAIVLISVGGGLAIIIPTTILIIKKKKRRI